MEVCFLLKGCAEMGIPSGWVGGSGFPPGGDSETQVLTPYDSTHIKTLKAVHIKGVKGKIAWRNVHGRVLFSK